ncbi:MAG: hypothetical protein QOH25_664 [Acidobacteriota bacterium]|jgi:hypothetical protein|nr:hypothetical protein [Acidobacteriota bacterium]
MKKVHKFLGAGLLVALVASAAIAQGPRAATKDTTPPAGVSAPKPPPAPQTFKAKYEGGIFGYNKKQDGTLSFDDVNKRLVFRNKEQKEVLAIPYSAVTGAYSDTKAGRPKAAQVVGALPLPYGANMLSWLARKKYRYLTLQYDDADARARGVTSFKVENKELLNSVLNTLAEKAELEAHGEIFIRRREMKVTAPEM